MNFFGKACVLGLGVAVAQAAEQPVGFNRDIRPILSENCLPCHGPDARKRKAELRLDVRDIAVDKGAIEPGHPEQSDAIRRIFETDPDEHMPPLDSRHSLTDAQKELLKRWIAEGAVYEKHWAYVPPVRPPLPTTSGKAAPANPIDAFIADTLGREGLTAAPEADRRTLIRRLSLDLVGLPPDPKDVDAFVASHDPRAYEQLVQRYLKSPHYGERMAIPWLDLVRYADTVGFHNDVPIGVWPYRDYVIRAFNRNLPFDQFTREQIAGDLLPGSTIEQRVASGYNRLHRISAEGGIQDKEYLAKYAADRVRTTATVWLGSTMACCECHDHKFDPFTTKDFYRFEAIFADLKELGAYNLKGGYTRENLTEETIFDTLANKEKCDSLDAEIAYLTAALKETTDEQLASGRKAWEAATLEAAKAGTLAWKVQRPLQVQSIAGATLRVEDDDSVVAGGKNPLDDTYVVTIPATPGQISAVLVESVSDPRFPGGDLARSGSAFYISEIEVAGLAAGAIQPTPIRIADSSTNGTTEPGHPVEAVIDGDPRTTLSFPNKKAGGIALRFAEPWHGGPGARLVVRIRHSPDHPYQNMGRFRVALHTLPHPDPTMKGAPANVLKTLKMTAERRTKAEKKELAAYYRTIAPELAPLRAKLTAATNARNYLVESLPSMPVSKSVAPRAIRVLPRGNWMDDSGELVEPGVPGFLRQVTPRDGQRVSRLDLADWLVAPDNPLVARTFVNRLWRLCFGTGLVRTLEDFGSQGEWPTHPELLDWLAVEFRESGWDVKHMVELIVTSRTYRQSSQGSVAADERDPQNRFLSHQNRFRLDAELVRDNALAMSGLLVDRVGGRSVRPYQPEGYYAPLNFPRREYVPDQGDELHRRGLYTHWQRTFLLPSLLAFDAPTRDECTANRAASNTPLQALVLLNDPSFVEAARVFAEKAMREGGWRFGSKLDWVFERAVARRPTADEARLLRGLFDRQRARYAHDTAAARQLVAVGATPVATDLPPADLAAWTAVTRAVLNLHETITRF